MPRQLFRGTKTQAQGEYEVHKGSLKKLDHMQINIFETNSLKGAVLSSPLIEFSTVFSATKQFQGQAWCWWIWSSLQDHYLTKGRLRDGQEIAIRRLQNSFTQGSKFKNEVTVLSKLQHQNLIKLILGVLFIEKRR